MATAKTRKQQIETLGVEDALKYTRIQERIDNQQTPDERDLQTTQLNNIMDDQGQQEPEQDELGYLRAQQKEIAARLKQLKAAAKPSAKSVKADLATVIVKQRELPGRWVVLGLLSQTNERVAAGQPLDEALAAVVQRYEEVAHEVMAMRAEGESLQDATWRHLRESYPKTNARTGPGSVAKAS